MTGLEKGGRSIADAVRNRPRVFLLEYDFTAFFDSINHDFLDEVIRTDLKASPREMLLINAFLKHSYAIGAQSYQQGSFSVVERGIPQGTSLSLFLANVACLRLDRELEKTGCVFARFADDTVIVCEDYATATQAASIMLGFGNRSGASVNFAKSEGISLVTEAVKSEIRSKRYFVFLGHEISSIGVAPSDRTIARWKRMVSRTISIHLLKHVRAGLLNPNRISNNGTDWDLVTCVNELRKRVYGRIGEAHLTAALKKSAPLQKTLCALTYYPLVNLPQKLEEIDGWLVSTVHRAYEKRRKFLAQLGYLVPNIKKKTLISGKWYADPSIPNETKLPSFFRAWLYIRKCHNTYGLHQFPSPPYVS